MPFLINSNGDLCLQLESYALTVTLLETKQTNLEFKISKNDLICDTEENPAFSS